MNMWLNALMLLAGIALIVCALYLLDRAGRCEISTRVGVAALLAIEGVLSVGLSASGAASWGAVVFAVLSAATAWLFIGTHYGRKCAHIEGWGITRPDLLTDADEPLLPPADARPALRGQPK